MKEDRELEEERNLLIKHAQALGILKIGFGDLRAVGVPLTSQYPIGISLIIPMETAIVERLDDQELFGHQMAQREQLESIKGSLGKMLSDFGYQWHSVSNDMDPTLLKGELSHKMVAAQAGLGWVGKSSLFITPEFGPRIRLTSILTDAPYKTADRMESGCGICTLCVDACPVGAICGREWRPGMNREQLLDVKLCADHRLKLGAGLNRRHSCAYCLRACPIGKKS